MKKFVTLTLALLIAVLALVPATAEGTDTRRLGVLTMLNLTETEMDNYIKARALIGMQLGREGLLTNQFLPPHENNGNDDEMDVKFEIIYFDTLDAMLMALNAGDVNEILIYDTVAQYLAHSDPGLVRVMTLSEDVDGSAFARVAKEGLMGNDFAFMFMEANAALRDEFDAALASITKEEMDKLI